MTDTTIEIGWEGEEPEVVIPLPLRPNQTMLAHPELVEMAVQMTKMED